ncbi:MAG: toxin [Chitinophagaceae bacterium]|nr:toxin [Chitinophagaceae bacterium]
MATQIEVEQFLNEFKVKMGVFNILFRDQRMKNTQTLLDLEMSWQMRKKTIESLIVEDFCEGPLDDTLYGIASMWVFGKYIKELEIYVKISMGRPNGSVLCISFHKAEHKMTYPFKKTK